MLSSLPYFFDHLYLSFLASHPFLSFFFFNDPATTAIYTLSLHDALPICLRRRGSSRTRRASRSLRHYHAPNPRHSQADRKSTRLNSSHTVISYAVFCLKKKNTN